MFIGVYMFDYDIHNYIYNKKNGGFNDWLEDTFSPDIDVVGILDLSIKGKTYAEKKGNARDLAIEWSNNYAGLNWSYGELAEVYTFFEKVGKRYGLLKEFKENGIC